ncbi:MAG TPA: glycosyltransferase [Polyangiaceae bacterium]|nr:glycosyltransferase [Polyangiaceae bacterium]
MMTNMDVKEILLFAAIAASVGLYLTMILGFVAAMWRRPLLPTPRATPRVSILKPLAGIDDELGENLASLADLDYPDYEILIGVASVDDAAFVEARRFVGRVGPAKARLFLTDPEQATNPKIAQLLTLERAATGEILLISDSNVRATRNYLTPLVAELARPGVAIVSSVIAGTGEQTLGAALENLQLAATVAPAVVSAARIARRPITVGKSMAMWRSALEQIGGLARVANLLSEDHMLGKAFAEAGFRVGLSLTPVANRNVACSLRRTVERHTRWAKLRRAIAPFGFWFEPLLSPIIMATAAGILLPGKTACLAFLAAVLLQTGCAFLSMRMLRGRSLGWHWAPLELVRTYVLFFCWTRACFSRRVSWRGHHFELARDSAIVPAEPGILDRVRSLVRA